MLTYAQVYAKRREQTLAANQSKLIEERTELAKKTLKLDFSSLGMSRCVCADVC
jgi:hypothetical protein